MISEQEPNKFEPKFSVVACFVEYAGKILLLQRQDKKPQSNTFGLPAGKVNAGEKILETMVRELREETGINVSSTELSYLGKLYVRYKTHDFLYHSFKTRLNQAPNIVITPVEHKGFRWESPRDALSLPLVEDFDGCIKLYYGL